MLFGENRVLKLSVIKLYKRSEYNLAIMQRPISISIPIFSEMAEWIFELARLLVLLD